MDTKTRSRVKSIIWRAIGIVLLGTIAYFITGNWKEMTMITVLFHGIRVILYYYHERVWECISWGRPKHPLSKIAVKKDLSPEDMGIIRQKLKDLGYM